MTNIALYLATVLLLGLSYTRDRGKTRKALKKALKAFKNILPQFLGIIVLVGLLMAVFDAAFISRLIGQESGWLGVLLSAVVGAVTLIPGIVAFPTAAMLIQGGAGYMKIGAFVSALMMVGVVTLPVELEYFGRRLSIARNLLAFLFSLLVAYIIGKVCGGLWF